MLKGRGWHKDVSITMQGSLGPSQSLSAARSEGSMNTSSHPSLRSIPILKMRPAGHHALFVRTEFKLVVL